MTEDELQIKVARYLDGLGVLWFHCPNEGKRTRKQGFKLRQKGLKPGVPDILIFNAPREYAREAGGKRPVGIGIELKKPGSSGQTFERYRRWECSALTTTPTNRERRSPFIWRTTFTFLPRPSGTPLHTYLTRIPTHGYSCAKIPLDSLLQMVPPIKPSHPIGRLSSLRLEPTARGR